MQRAVADTYTSELLVPKLFADGKISEKTFSVYLNNNEDAMDCAGCVSYIDFGPPDTSVIGSETVKWVPVETDKQFW